MKTTLRLFLACLLCLAPIAAQAQCVEGNCINGSGTKITRGHKYSGEFVNNHRHGYGSYTFPNGDRYEGEFVKGNIEGSGVYYYANGDVYKGGFLDGLPHGVGEVLNLDGKSVKGVFERGVLVGPDEQVVSHDLEETPQDLPDSVGVQPWDNDGDNVSVEQIIESQQ